ncbi:MAG: folate-binding protein YgfZ, partial [Candidatus Berkiella sp.]
CITQRHPEGTLTLCNVPGTDSRFELIVANPGVRDIEQQFLSKLTLLQETDWERYDIEAGIPAIYPATIDTLLPHHVNLTELGGISFDKGCYLGQEIVARMHYRGKIKRHMYLAELENNIELPCPGDQVVILNAPNEAPGIVVRASPKDQGVVLLVVLDEQYADFENIRYKKADGPKLHRLNLSY